MTAARRIPRRFSRRLLLLALLGVGLAIPEAIARPPADAEFLPLKVGSRWTYVSHDGHESDETVGGAIEVTGLDGRPVGTAASIATGEGREFYYLRTNKGVARFYEPPSDPAIQQVTWVLRFPLQLGARWESWTPAGKFEFRVTDRRSITAPDGSLTDGVRVDFVSLPEPIFAGHIWYARGIGPVEIVEGDYNRKLLGFRPGTGAELPVTSRMDVFEPPDVKGGWRLGRKGWFALGLVLATAIGIALVPRMKRPMRKPHWDDAAIPPELVEEEGALPVQAARLEASIASHPNYADLRCKLGSVYLAMERLDDAIAQFETALQLNGRYVQAGLGLTRALLRAKRAPEAVATIRPFAERHPTYADVQNLLGEAHRDAGDAAAAEACFRKALSINAGFQAAQRNLDALPGAGAVTPSGDSRDGERRG